MIKRIDKKYHAMIQEWGRNNHDFVILPENYLPDGLVCFLCEKPIIASWMFVTNDLLMGFIAFTIANPESTRDERDLCFPELMNAFDKTAKEQGIEFLFTTSNNDSLQKRIVDFGFSECDKNVVHFLKKV